jgi:hypothetical protein
MKHGTNYKIVVYRDGDFLGSAVARRIGAHHVECSTSVIDQIYVEEVADVAKQVVGAFEYLLTRPRLGELVQRRIDEFAETESDQNESDESDPSWSPF